ncbi:hypothetical protein MLD38_025793 [Melastoma candidum]|uniref:Uncharacterized protein n=1 Tax=Melastoma candidum TaxID=119954 RepID=A0ACB9NXG1_9MYRT|nr:hypothetical protein MLD38_025793 [Melastoma candidum]
MDFPSGGSTRPARSPRDSDYVAYPTQARSIPYASTQQTLCKHAANPTQADGSLRPRFLHTEFYTTEAGQSLTFCAPEAVTLSSHGGVWMVAMACESWFTFLWVLTLSTKWNPGTFKTYPQRLFEG